MAFLEVTGVGRLEGDKRILNGISFSMERFQKLAIAGATGSGKTSLLKIIGGRLQPNEGKVFFDGAKLKGPEEKLMPGHPKIAYLSQHFELRNNYRVEEIMQLNNHFSNAAAENLFQLCDITHLLRRWTHHLSGGERQRVALASLLLSAPSLLLLDEPFTNLDAFHKSTLKSVLENIGAELKITFLLVSHDAADILPWADEMLVLEEGKLIQQGTPAQIYFQPINNYTAALFGAYIKVTPELREAFAPFSANPLTQTIIRPSQLRLVEKGNGVRAEVVKTSLMGTHYETEVKSSAGTFLFHHPNHIGRETVVYLALDDLSGMR